MSQTMLLMVGMLPAALVILAGMLVLHSRAGINNDRRVLFFLLAVGTVLLLAIFVSGLLPNAQSDRFASSVGPLVTPSLVGILTLVLIRIKSLAGSSRKDLIFAGLLVIGILALLGGIWFQPSGYGQMVVLGFLGLAIPWLLASRFEAGAFALSLLAIAGMAEFISSWWARSYQTFPSWIFTLIGIALFFAPAIAISLAGYFTLTSFRKLAQPAEAAQAGTQRTNWLSTAARLGFALFLVGDVAFTIYWASIWDQTSDGLGGIFILFEAAPIAIGAGIILAFGLTGGRRLAGAGFAALALLLMTTAFNQGWNWGIYQPMTNQRAARIQTALEGFHARNARYPASLSELTPRDLLWIPVPIILQGESWCYQGGPDFFRLGAIYRDSFSSPLSYKVYAAAGSPPSQPSTCEDRLPELKKMHDPPPMSAMQANLPTAEPKPTSQVSIPRQSVQPLVEAISIETGGWSPDGRFFFFGVPEAVGSQNMINLRFLDGETGQVCSLGQLFPLDDDLRGHSSWLPDGSVLFLSTDQELVLISPCRPDFERLSSRYPVKFTQIMATYPTDNSSNNPRLLLKTDSGYWLLDKHSLEAGQIAGASPAPGSPRGDFAAWSPGGDQLAINSLNGAGQDAGGTLFIVNAAARQVVRQIPMPDSTAQSSLIIEWLSDHELIYTSKDKLLVIDLAAAPPRTTDVMKDLFSLDIAYPDEISTMASLLDPSGNSYHLAVRVNHARNKSIYLYHSETGKVEVLNSATHVLLFFPGGDWTEMRLLDEPFSDRDEFEMVWVDQPGKASQRLVVEGHQPRNYPTLYLNYLAEKSQMIFSSSQGISLISLPDGKLLGFWELADQQYHYQPYLILSPDQRAAAAVADGDGLYFLRLEK